MGSNDSSEKNILRVSHVPPNCLIFGTSKLFAENILPTYEDVMKCYLFQRFQLKRQSKKDPSAKLIAKNVSERIKSIWDKASIPTVTDERIYQKLIDYHTNYKKNNTICSPKNAEGFKIICGNFHQQAQHIFDVVYCKCSPDSKWGCIKSKKFPIKEVAFLIDQRNERK